MSIMLECRILKLLVNLKIGQVPFLMPDEVQRKSDIKISQDKINAMLHI